MTIARNFITVIVGIVLSAAACESGSSQSSRSAALPDNDPFSTTTCKLLDGDKMAELTNNDVTRVVADERRAGEARQFEVAKNPPVLSRRSSGCSYQIDGIEVSLVLLELQERPSFPTPDLSSLTGGDYYPATASPFSSSTISRDLIVTAGFDPMLSYIRNVPGTGDTLFVGQDEGSLLALWLLMPGVSGPTDGTRGTLPSGVHRAARLVYERAGLD